jgi:LCP family protein required for cell wall assembly
VSQSPHEVALPPELNPRGPQPGQRRRTRSKVARFLSWVAVVTSVVVLVGSGVAYLGLRKLTNNMEVIPAPAVFPSCAPSADNPCKPRPPKVESVTGGTITNYLVIGSDSVDGISLADRKRLKITDEENRAGRRSDTMLLIHVPADAAGAYVLSFPRDLYVPIAGTNKTDRINAAYATGGPARAIATVEQLTNIHIDHYLEVNVLAFANVVDGLGGVPMCIPKAMKSKKAHLNLRAGEQTLDGPTALSFVRARTFDPDSEYDSRNGDLGRVQRQQLFVGALIRRALSAGTIANPIKLSRFLDRSTKALKVDGRLGTSQLLELGKRFRNLDTKRVIFASVPIANPDFRPIPTKSVATMKTAEAAEIFAAVADGSILGGKKRPTATTSGPPLKVAPAAIRVRVRNGNGVSGQAKTTSEALRGIGFVITGATNADNTDYTETVVRHGPEKADSARTVAAAIPARGSSSTRRSAARSMWSSGATTRACGPSRSRLRAPRRSRSRRR